MQFDSVFTILIIMKILLTLFVLLFPSSVVADDISDFQIEGMSVGDSLLKYFSADQIKSEIELKSDVYVKLGFDKSFVEVDFFSKEKTYDQLSFWIKPEDPKYIIYSISGKILYERNIDQCYEKLNEIVNEFSSMFKDAEQMEEEGSHMADITGKSTFKTVYFHLNSGGVEVSCYDFDKTMQVTGNEDNLGIFIDNKEFIEWFVQP